MDLSLSQLRLSNKQILKKKKRLLTSIMESCWVTSHLFLQHNKLILELHLPRTRVQQAWEGSEAPAGEGAAALAPRPRAGKARVLSVSPKSRRGAGSRITDTQDGKPQSRLGLVTPAGGPQLYF